MKNWFAIAPFSSIWLRVFGIGRFGSSFSVLDAALTLLDGPVLWLRFLARSHSIEMLLKKRDIPSREAIVPKRNGSTAHFSFEPKQLVVEFRHRHSWPVVP